MLEMLFLHPEGLPQDLLLVALLHLPGDHVLVLGSLLPQEVKGYAAASNRNEFWLTSPQFHTQGTHLSHHKCIERHAPIHCFPQSSFLSPDCCLRVSTVYSLFILVFPVCNLSLLFQAEVRRERH